jgi:hypothetical protein
LQARTEEGAIMQRMDTVPALRSRYDSIVREYESEMTKALAKDAGVDPETDFYCRLQATVLLSTVVSTARWVSDMFGGRVGPGNDPEIFPKLIMSRLPSRKDVEKEEARYVASVKRKISRGSKKLSRKPAR